MNSNEVYFVEKYGPFKPGLPYKCLGYGYDYARVKCNSKVYNVPIQFLGDNIYEESEVEYEDAR